jgi:hypothetical protein
MSIMMSGKRVAVRHWRKIDGVRSESGGLTAVDIEVGDEYVYQAGDDASVHLGRGRQTSPPSTICRPVRESELVDVDDDHESGEDMRATAKGIEEISDLPFTSDRSKERGDLGAKCLHLLSIHSC